MTYASAYPNSDISAGAMAAIAVVMIAVLAFWLVMVYLAAREPHHRLAGSDEPRGKTAVTGAREASGEVERV